jgi:hypothetical protein
MDSTHGGPYRASNRPSMPSCLVALTLAVLAALAPLAARAEGPIAGNVVANWGLESFDPPYADYNGHPLQVAAGWTRFQLSGDEPRFMSDNEYASTFAKSGAIPRHLEGNASQNLWLGHPFEAGIYQQMPVAPGKPYAVKAMWLSAVGSTVGQATDKMMKQIGIDPYGGTNPTSPWIVWGDESGRNKSFLDTRAAARAKGDKITLFIKLKNLPETKPDWDAAWIDAVVAVEAPECKATSPANSPTGSFNVEWSAQNPPNGQLKGQYDVDYKDGMNGPWIRWQSQTGATSATFDKGEAGHSYYFRARAWARYSDLVDLYGAFSTGGDTFTIVGAPAS